MAEYLATSSAVPVTLPRPVVDPVPHKLPPIFRVESLERTPVNGCHHRCRATLFHEQAAITVEWLAQHVDVRIAKGCLVSIRWLGNPQCIAGTIHISRLVLIERPEVACNLLQTIPYGWIRDRELVGRAARLWEQLPRGFQQLFNAIFWDGKRLHRYIAGPSSLSGHHNNLNGNFRHSVEVAEQALALGREKPTSFAPVLIIGGLLHDAGKADEYRYDHARRCFEMSPRGALIGHKNTLLEWIAAAMARDRIILPEAHYLALVHALTAAKGAPVWLGLREPLSLDATLLSMADRLSGQGDLHLRMAPAQDGFGRYHRHLGGRPYVVADRSAVHSVELQQGGRP